MIKAMILLRLNSSTVAIIVYTCYDIIISYIATPLSVPAGKKINNIECSPTFNIVDLHVTTCARAFTVFIIGV